MDNLTEKTAVAQERANKTGLTHYVGCRYDLKLYVSKVKPRTSDGGMWLKATCEPQIALEAARFCKGCGGNLFPDNADRCDGCSGMVARKAELAPVGIGWTTESFEATSIRVGPVKRVAGRLRRFRG